MTPNGTFALLAIGMPGPMEMAVILVLLLLIFGPQKLPALARAIGSSVNEFKDALSGKTRAIDRDDEDEDDAERPERPAIAAKSDKTAESQPAEREPAKHD